ncbi:MAG: ABC transporter substrate-binding protein [Alphaproteobacteria bacterium]|nr:ABC transporter substrate-binding protein [Alphaproteobacteria bacterium]
MTGHLNKRFGKTCIAILFATSVFSIAVEADDIQFLTHAPAVGKATYIDDTGTLRGMPGGGRRAFLVELVNAMITERSSNAKITEVPFNRGKKLIENKTGYAFFNVMRNARRENRFKWVGPIYSLPTYFYSYQDSGEKISNVADARSAKAVCGIRGTNNISWLRRHGFRNIFEASSFDACLLLMIYGRVTLIQSAEVPEILLNRQVQGKQVLRFTGVANHDELLHDEGVLKGYLAFNRGTKDSQIKAWQQALDSIKASDLYEQLRQEFLLPATSQPPYNTTDFADFSGTSPSAAFSVVNRR